MIKSGENELDLSKLPEVRIDVETDGFQPRWDNTILMTAYDRTRTFILTSDGRHLVLGHSLQETLTKFASDNDVDDYIMRSLYGKIGRSKGRGLIAGNNRLVPTHGKTNKHVAYYMANLLDSHDHCNQRDMELAAFVSEGQTYYVYFDTAKKTFKKLIDAADAVATLQLDALKWLKHNYGDAKIEERRGVRTFQDGRQYRQTCHAIMYAKVMEIARQTFLDECTAEYQKEIAEKIKRLTNPDL